MSHNLKHCEPTVGASMWSLLQLLQEGGYATWWMMQSPCQCNVQV